MYPPEVFSRIFGNNSTPLFYFPPEPAHHYVKLSTISLYAVICPPRSFIRYSKSITSWFCIPSCSARAFAACKLLTGANGLTLSLHTI